MAKIKKFAGLYEYEISNGQLKKFMGSVLYTVNDRGEIKPYVGLYEYKIDGDCIRSFQGQILLRFDGRNIKEFSGFTIARIENNCINEYNGMTRYQVDGYLSKNEWMLLITFLFLINDWKH